MTNDKDVVIIGSGNVATHLALALNANGFCISQIYSRLLPNAQLLADRVGATAISSLTDISSDAKWYIISVKDDAIPQIADILFSRISPDAYVLHTAGSVSIDVLKAKFAHCGVLYPMQTFTKSRELDFSVVPCFIEGADDDCFEEILHFTEHISSRVVAADSHKRKIMHLAAVFACNMVNHCYSLAEQILNENHLDFSLLYPLIAETASKAQTMSPYEAQTGPMIRYDQSVMTAQKSMLHYADMIQLYDIMAKSIHKRHAK